MTIAILTLVLKTLVLMTIAIKTLVLMTIPSYKDSSYNDSSCRYKTGAGLRDGRRLVRLSISVNNISHI